MKIIVYIFILTCSSVAFNHIFAADKVASVEEQVTEESNYEESAPMEKGRSIASKQELLDQTEIESSAPERNAQECYQKINQDDIDSCLENL